MAEFPYYRKKIETQPEPPVKLPPSPLDRLRDGSFYEPSEPLMKAVNVALLLGQPLLVTGEPGTGKTELARSVAWQLNYGDKEGKPILFSAKSTSESKHLFYNYDMLGRFGAARNARRAAEYIQYNGLGRAIIRTWPLQKIQDILPTSEHETHDGPRASVVLIDEIDKAPRDFPNDILNEIERLEFTIPELGHVPVKADPHYRPVVILTSNAEKSLPPAFLRRCVYFHIEFPDKDGLKAIVERRVGKFPSDGLIADAVRFFLKLRDDQTGLQKKPATAELLGWIVYLQERQADMSRPLKKNREAALESLPALVKEKEGQQAAQTLLENWLKD